jgi:hypothetical protein
LPRALRSSRALDVDIEAVENPDERLVDGGQFPAVTFDLHRIAVAELLLLDARHLVAVTVLQDEGVRTRSALPSTA